MKRKKHPNYILTSDWHIRLDKPICRTDDFLTAQSTKIKFILSLARNCNCPILITGDVGHKPLWGDRLLNYFIDILNDFQDVDIYTICGQHDLINHRLDKHKEGGLGVLSKNGYIKILTKKFKTIQPFSYGEKIKDIDSEIILVHRMIIKSQKDKLWNDQNAHSAKWHLRKLPSAKLIVSGDNHQSFTTEFEGRWLVNAGSLMRMTANQIDHKPSVYLWYAEDNSIERVYLPMEEGVINREHIDVANERNERIESFVSRLKETEELGLSYEDNMKEFFRTNRTRRKVMEKVWSSME